MVETQEREPFHWQSAISYKTREKIVVRGYDYKEDLQALKPVPFDTKSESNRDDIRAYLRHELATQLEGRADADRLVERILEKGEGVFLYVEKFCDEVRQAHLSLDRPEQLPQGLGGIFFQWFQRQFPDLEEFRRDFRPALRAILAASVGSQTAPPPSL